MAGWNWICPLDRCQGLVSWKSFGGTRSSSLTQQIEHVLGSRSSASSRELWCARAQLPHLWMIHEQPCCQAQSRSHGHKQARIESRRTHLYVFLNQQCRRCRIAICGKLDISRSHTARRRLLYKSIWSTGGCCDTEILLTCKFCWAAKGQK